MINFMRVLARKYHIDEPTDIAASHPGHAAAIAAPNDIHARADFLLDNYNPDVFYENPPGGKDTAYTLSKGSAMYLCMRNLDNTRELVDHNTLLFVMLHECSHIANYRGWNHGEDFWETFKWILHEARLAGVYTPVDYAKYPVMYCGMKIAYNPLFDPSVRQIWVA